MLAAARTGLNGIAETVRKIVVAHGYAVVGFEMSNERLDRGRSPHLPPNLLI